MNEQKQDMSVFLDTLPNQQKNDDTRESFKQLFRQRFEDRLAEAVERIWDLPSIVVEPNGEYLALLNEARHLYLMGHFYSCVAMCGIVGERLVKDVFRASTLIQKDGTPQLPPSSAFDQFERVEVSGITRFLTRCPLCAHTTGQRKIPLLIHAVGHCSLTLTTIGRAGPPAENSSLIFVHEFETVHLPLPQYNHNLSSQYA